MKRSDVVKYLTIEYESSQYGGMSEMTNEERMDYLLKKLEDLDMLPPKMQGIYDNVPSVTPTGHLDYSFKRGWEPED